MDNKKLLLPYKSTQNVIFKRNFGQKPKKLRKSNNVYRNEHNYTFSILVDFRFMCHVKGMKNL